MIVMIITENNHQMQQLLYEIREMEEVEIYTYKHPEEADYIVRPDLIFCDRSFHQKIQNQWNEEIMTISIDTLYKGEHQKNLDKISLFNIINTLKLGGTL